MKREGNPRQGRKTERKKATPPYLRKPSSSRTRLGPLRGLNRRPHPTSSSRMRWGHRCLGPARRSRWPGSRGGDWDEFSNECVEYTPPLTVSKAISENLEVYSRVHEGLGGDDAAGSAVRGWAAHVLRERSSDRRGVEDLNSQWRLKRTWSA